jgi:GntR family transcriptional regulator
LKPEDELPSVRGLASKHLINPNTVARAYLELEREGLVSKRRGMGTYISQEAVTWLPEHTSEVVAAIIDQAVTTAIEFGFRGDQIRTLFEERLSHVYSAHRV